ncbi:MAG: hypothetical protein K1X95_10320 [Acidimicrobiia bacterium]|nr:hypothetical protein [Acidimicrobiia bacterium]
MTTAVALDLRELETGGTVVVPDSVVRERSRLRERRLRRIADDVRARVYPIDADRVAASIVRRLTA